jgi:hypothetical protein
MTYFSIGPILLVRMVAKPPITPTRVANHILVA